MVGKNPRNICVPLDGGYDVLRGYDVLLWVKLWAIHDAIMKLK